MPPDVRAAAKVEALSVRQPRSDEIDHGRPLFNTPHARPTAWEEKSKPARRAPAKNNLAWPRIGPWAVACEAHHALRCAVQLKTHIWKDHEQRLRLSISARAARPARKPSHMASHRHAKWPEGGLVRRTTR